MAILGPNASGKSTLLQLIAGSLAPLSGRVLLDGIEIGSLDARTRAQRIAVVQQHAPLVFPAIAGEFVLQGRHPYGRALHLANEEDVTLAQNALVGIQISWGRDGLISRVPMIRLFAIRAEEAAAYHRLCAYKIPRSLDSVGNVATEDQPKIDIDRLGAAENERCLGR